MGQYCWRSLQISLVYLSIWVPVAKVQLFDEGQFEGEHFHDGIFSQILGIYLDHLLIVQVFLHCLPIVAQVLLSHQQLGFLR
jgi:hypothetical protein